MTEPGNREIYDRVAAVGAKIDAYMARVDERLDHGSRQIADHEARIRLLEQARWKAAGAATLAGGAAGAVLSWLLEHH